MTAFEELNETIAEGPDKGQSWESWNAEVDALVEAINNRPDGCDRFAPPAAGDCPLIGSLSTCNPPCIHERPDGCDIATLPFDEADGLYDFVYNVSSVNEQIDWEAVDIVQYAWAVLLDNLDLVAWTGLPVLRRAGAGPACLSHWASCSASPVRYPNASRRESKAGHRISPSTSSTVSLKRPVLNGQQCADRDD